MPKDSYTAPIKGRHILALVTRALGKDHKSIVDELIRRRKPTEGGDSEPNVRAFRALLRQASGRADIEHSAGGSGARPRREKGGLTSKMARVIENYLDDHQVRSVPDREAYEQARSLCHAVIWRKGKSTPFEELMPTDPHRGDVMEAFCGAYVVLRRETGDQRIVQELLLLEKEGQQGVALLIQDQCVHRGSWGVMRNTIAVLTVGSNSSNAYDTISIHLGFGEVQTQKFCGVLSGIGTNDGFPVTMPIAAMRFRSPHRSLTNIMKLSDRAIYAAARRVPRYAPERIAPKVAEFLDEQFKAFDANPKRMADALDKMGVDRPEALATPELEEFIRDDHSLLLPRRPLRAVAS
jgi:hypothetical protein